MELKDLSLIKMNNEELLEAKKTVNEFIKFLETEYNDNDKEE